MDFSLLGIGGVAAITVICFLAGELAKRLPRLESWIPVICGALGAILGPVGWRIMPDFPAPDALTAVAVGIVSGLAATGAHQIYKQRTKDPGDLNH